MTSKAGWYPNPSEGPPLRWWDGEQWTDSVSYPVPVVSGESAEDRWMREVAAVPDQRYDGAVQRQKVADSMDAFIDHAAHSFGGQIIVLMATVAAFVVVTAFVGNLFGPGPEWQSIATGLAGAVFTYKTMSKVIFGGADTLGWLSWVVFGFIIFLIIAFGHAIVSGNALFYIP
jgi:hypothetical protein